MAVVEGAGGEDVDYHRLNHQGEMMTLVFDVHVNKKYGVLKREIPDLEIYRTQPARLKDLTEHLEVYLELPGGHGRKLLLQALCDKTLLTVGDHQRELAGIVPLVCDQIWSSVLNDYSHRRLKILVDQYKAFTPHGSRCAARIFKHELKFVDMTSFLPTKNLKPHNIMELCQYIFNKDTKVKPELRKGVWMHLVGVYHPDLKSRREREDYIERLRRVYDSLKGKWQVKQSDNNSELNHILEAVQRDAVRTDPNHPFYATEIKSGAQAEIKEGDNVQKLVNIITIYTLEHSELSYTQGMTDLLSPILYVMQREADAYICFSAMVERIKDHFGLWCEGTLHKLERLRHLCEVLDPQLFHYLTNTIEEDAFALFFGMVLIECRREFSFEDSFHLLEAVWAGVACMKDKIPQSTELSYSEWAHFMSYDSRDDLQQVFGEIECAYTAEPLRHNTISDGYSIEYRPEYSRNNSLASRSHSPTYVEGGERPRPKSAPQAGFGEPSTEMSINPSDGSASGTLPYAYSHVGVPIHGVTEVTVEPNGEADLEEPDTRPRSYTDPSSLMSSQSDSQVITGASEQETGSVTNVAYSHSESELYDSFSQSNKVPLKNPRKRALKKNPTEMSDMSSISSSNGNSQFLESFDSRNAQESSRSRSRSPLSEDAPKNTALSPESTDAAPESVFSDPEKTPTHDGYPPLSNMPGPITSESSVYQTAPSSSASSSRDVTKMNGHVTTGSGLRKKSDDPSSSSFYQTAPSSSSTSSRELAMNGHVATAAAAAATDDSEPVVKKKTKSRVVQQGGRLTIEHFAESSLPFPESPAEDHLQSTLTESSPGRGRRKITVPIEVNRSSPYDEDLVSGSSRVTPVAFFDTMEQLASSVPSSNANFDHTPEHKNEVDLAENQDPIPTYRQRRHSRANSEISVIISQLISTEQAAPRVTREKSLAVPVSDCFPLFVCLAILVQNRHHIMKGTTDFVGLSVLLNAQAGKQNIDSTLRVAKSLYKTYRRYQLLYFGPENLDQWLDMDGIVKDRRETGRSNPASQDLRSRTSQADDSVFVNST